MTSNQSRHNLSAARKVSPLIHQLIPHAAVHRPAAKGQQRVASSLPLDKSALNVLAARENVEQAQTLARALAFGAIGFEQEHAQPPPSKIASHASRDRRTTLASPCGGDEHGLTSGSRAGVQGGAQILKPGAEIERLRLSRFVRRTRLRERHKSADRRARDAFSLLRGLECRPHQLAPERIAKGGQQSGAA